MESTMDVFKKRNHVDSSLSELRETPTKKTKIDAAWHDEDDDISDELGIRDRKVKYQAKQNTPYLSRLEEAFELVHGPTPDWATTYCENVADDEDDKNDLEKLEKYGNLPPNELQFERCAPLNIETKDEGPIIRSIKFNPVNNVALVAGDSIVNMIRVTSGKSQPLLQKISFPNLQLKEVTWSYSSTDFYVTSRKDRINWFTHYNVTAGKSIVVKPNSLTRDDRIGKLIADPSKRFLIGLGNKGQIHVFSETTKEYIDTLHMSNNVNDATFSSDGRLLYTFGGDGEIFVWDMNQRECINAWYDDNHGPLEPHCLARCSEYIAFGSESGIVNVYSNSDLDDVSYKNKGSKRNRMPKPRKEFKNLVTPITGMAMNSQSEILAVASSYKEGAFRLLHLPSMTTFQNFATNGRELGRINCVDFSPASGYLSFGNNRGTAFLYRLKHYAAY